MMKLSVIDKIKIISSLVITTMLTYMLYEQGKAQAVDYVFAIFVIPFSILMWNQRLYNAMQKERPFKMSYTTFERLSLLGPILLFISIFGIWLRQ